MRMANEKFLILIWLVYALLNLNNTKQLCTGNSPRPHGTMCAKCNLLIVFI